MYQTRNFYRLAVQQLITDIESEALGNYIYNPPDYDTLLSDQRKEEKVKIFNTNEQEVNEDQSDHRLTMESKKVMKGKDDEFEERFSREEQIRADVKHRVLWLPSVFWFGECLIDRLIHPLIHIDITNERLHTGESNAGTGSVQLFSRYTCDCPEKNKRSSSCSRVCKHKNDNVHRCQCRICMDTSVYSCTCSLIKKIDITTPEEEIIEKDHSISEFSNIFIALHCDDNICVTSGVERPIAMVLLSENLNPYTVKRPIFTNIFHLFLYINLYMKDGETKINVFCRNSDIEIFHCHVSLFYYTTRAAVNISREEVPKVVSDDTCMDYIPAVVLVSFYFLLKSGSQHTSSDREGQKLLEPASPKKKNYLDKSKQYTHVAITLACLAMMHGNIVMRQTSKVMERQKCKLDDYALEEAAQQKKCKGEKVRYIVSQHTDKAVMKSKLSTLLHEALSIQNKRAALKEALMFRDTSLFQQEAFVYPFHGEIRALQRGLNRNTLNPLLERYATPAPPTRQETMSHELLRLCTLQDFPVVQPPSFLRLAQAGLYYEGQGNSLTCFSCGWKYQNWQSNDNPIEVHRQFSPSCRFINGFSSGNIPVRYTEDQVDRLEQDLPSSDRNTLTTDEGSRGNRVNNMPNGALEIDHITGTRAVSAGPRSQNGSTDSDGSSVLTTGPSRDSISQSGDNPTASESPVATTARTSNDSGIGSSSNSDSQQRQILPANTGYVPNTRMANLQYSVEARRLDSFKNWPPTNTQHPNDMTAAGFYYSGDRDSVKCFQCGIGLRNWDRGDNPWIEHARWSPQCQYMLQVKGEEFIALVREAAERAERENNEAQYNASTSESTGNGVSEDSGISTRGNDNISGGDTSARDGGTRSSGRDNTEVKSNTAQEPHGTRVLPSPTAPRYPLQTEAAQCVIKKGFLPKVVKIGIDKVVERIGWGGLDADTLLKEVQQIDHDSGLGSEASGSSGSSGSEHDKRVKIPKNNDEIVIQNRELKDLLTCKICLDETVSIAFLPCGHLVACAQCSPALVKCPICRKGIKGTVRTNLLDGY